MIPLFTTQQVREADKYAIEKLQIPGMVLMENAALSIYNEIIDTFGDFIDYQPVGIICGKGNNAGDGFAVARHFINNGYTVKIMTVAEEKELKGDALKNYKILLKLLEIYTESEIIEFEKPRDVSKLSDCALIIDALLGTGAKGELKSPYNIIIEKINQINSVKVAIDIPSGLNADDGSGSLIFKADLTISLAELKRGLFIGKGYANCGEVKKGYIGIGSEYFGFQELEDYLIEPEDAIEGIPVKNVDQYKYSAGKVLVVAGSGLMPGAAIFATNSCQKIGAGAAYLAFPRSIKEVAQNNLDTAILYAYNDERREILTYDNVEEFIDKIKWADVLALGPGLGRDIETCEAVYEILLNAGTKKCVIDADAIFALRGGQYKNINLKNKVFTPHHKEFSELIGVDLPKLQANLLKYGKEFVTENKCYLVLKGAPTIVFNPEGEALINSAGNPGMAKFGTGDVLTGIIAGLIAQSDDIESAIVTGVYIHSLSADLLLKDKTEFGFNAKDLMENLPYTINFLRNTIERTY
ncbi:MAG: NAD(P)H-hydrate dehydratase [Rhodothermaceae bacterium]